MLSIAYFKFKTEDTFKAFVPGKAISSGFNLLACTIVSSGATWPATADSGLEEVPLPQDGAVKEQPLTFSWTAKSAYGKAYRTPEHQKSDSRM